jgi:hypothetical protein
MYVGRSLSEEEKEGEAQLFSSSQVELAFWMLSLGGTGIVVENRFRHPLELVWSLSRRFEFHSDEMNEEKTKNNDT